MNKDDFVRKYYNYYINLEEQLIGTRKYVNFEENNFKVYSDEYIKLLQLICSEIDVIAKKIVEISKKNNKEYDTISKWGFEIQQLYSYIDKVELIFDGTFRIIPWKKWKYVKSKNINGKVLIKLMDKNCSNPEWWTSYNKVKHNRTDSYQKGFQYQRANLINVINALGALYLFEILLLKTIDNNITFSLLNIKKSSLFWINNENLEYIEKNNLVNV